jgi:hypothetical protein
MSNAGEIFPTTADVLRSNIVSMKNCEIVKNKAQKRN